MLALSNRARRPLLRKHGDEWRAPFLGWIGQCKLLPFYTVTAIMYPMKQKRAFKYRVYPTPEQQQILAQTFGCCRARL
nr:helix-turn-helix domain-containing protein [Ktedonobacter sp. SOSP1-85]